MHIGEDSAVERRDDLSDKLSARDHHLVVQLGDKDTAGVGVDKGDSVATLADDALTDTRWVWRVGPDAEMVHEIDDAVDKMLAHGVAYASADSHFGHEAWSARGVERVSESGLEHGSGLMNPNEVDAHNLGIRDKSWRCGLGDTHLRKFAKEDVGGMNIYDHIGSEKRRVDVVSDTFDHGAIDIAGKDTIHVEVEGRDAALHGVDTERIEGRIDVDSARELVDILADHLGDKIADILAFEFIAMRTRNDADTFAGAIGKMVADDTELLVDRHFERCNRLDHIM